MSFCPYKDKYHVCDAASCIVTPTASMTSEAAEKTSIVTDRENLRQPLRYVHVYMNAKYSTHPVTGAPLYYSLNDQLKSFVDINSFNLNSNSCCLSSKPFDFDRYVHLLSYKCETVADYWNTVYNFKHFWTGEMESLREKMRYENAAATAAGEDASTAGIATTTTAVWPYEPTVLDALVDKYDPSRWKLLRPLTFSKSPLYFRKALREFMYRLFCNCSDAVNIAWSSVRRRPKRSKCEYEDCKICRLSVPVSVYNVFGKGNSIHSVTCVPDEYLLNDEWWDLTDAFIDYRTLCTATDYDYDDNEDDYEGYNYRGIKTVTANKLKSLHNRFRNSVARIEMLREGDDGI